MSYSGLYVHIPFCKSKCRYCDFNSFAGKDECIAPYFHALKKEISYWAEAEKGRRFDTVYFGGGTPSYMSPEILESTIAHIKNEMILTEDCEITVECNPATMDNEGFERLKLVGANRISIGLQSTDDSMLKVLGRIHSLEDFERCFLYARGAGFKNISLDLMYGLPGQTMKMWEETLEKAAAYRPEHISAYALKIEEGTPFSKMDLDLPDEDVSADMYQRMVEILEEKGYHRYEISNFAKPGFESRHNQKYWERVDYLGVGAGAYSCFDNKRFSNTREVWEYIFSVLDKGNAVCEEAVLSEKERMSEFVFLGLRLQKGISLKEFEGRFGVSFSEVFGKAAEKYIDWGFLVKDGDRLFFSPKGFFVSNTILADFV